MNFVYHCEYSIARNPRAPRRHYRTGADMALDGMWSDISFEFLNGKDMAV